jgi:hypothetical protein
MQHEITIESVEPLVNVVGQDIDHQLLRLFERAAILTINRKSSDPGCASTLRMP